MKYDIIFNCWQVYAESQKLLDQKENTAFRKVLFINDRQDVLDFKVYRIDNDVMVISKNESSVYIAFIGSNDIMDWINNFDSNLVPINKTDSAKVHDGFSKSAIKFNDLIEMEARPYLYKNIYFIGHSRGGALATICAINLTNILGMTPTHLQIITYGQPRVGNHSYCKILFDKKINYCRVYFKEDIVTNIPPISMGYEHPWFSNKLELPKSWWHKLPFMFKRVHLDYNRVINTKLIKMINNQGY